MRGWFLYSLVRQHNRIVNECALEFSARRTKTWQKSWPWIVVTFAGFGIGAIVGDLDDSSTAMLWSFGALSMGLTMLGIYMTVRIVRIHYRCPKCEKVVSTWDGVPVAPKECPHCGVSFR